MDPFYEQRMRDEVMYLHSLWHQGPPTNPKPNQRNAHHSNPAKLNQVNKKIRKRGKRGGKGMKLPPPSDIEWPCKEINEVPSSSSSGWPTFNPVKNQPSRLPSAEEQARLVAIQLQQKALKAAQDFFSANGDSDGGEDSDIGDDDDDLMVEDGYTEYRFIAKVFEEDVELRGYYEKNREGGEFCCLVCGGIGQKVGKRFKNCVALVQHSVAIANTKRKHAHRAYAQVICKVLGWDINRLPPVNLSSDKLTEPKENAEFGIGNSSNDNKDSALDNVHNGELVVKEVPEVSQDEELQSSTILERSNVIGDNVMSCEGNVDEGYSSIHNIDAGLSNVDNCESNFKEEADIGQKQEVCTGTIPSTSNNADDDMILCESSLKVDDANTCMDNIENGASNTDGNSRVVRHLECRKDDSVGNEIEVGQEGIAVANHMENNGNPM